MNGAALAVAAAAAAVAGLCAAADGALLSLDSADAHADARVAPIFADRERLHRTLSFGRVTALLAAGAAVSLGLGLAHRATVDAVLIVAFIAMLTVSAVEAGARALGEELGTQAILQLAPLVAGLEVALAPAVWVGSRVDAVLRRLLPPPPRREEEREATAEQFRQVVAAEADVSNEEEALIEGVFSLGDTEVREVMLPRVDIVGIERGTPWSEVIDRVRSSEHARFPVYEETIDEVVGVLYAKDLLPAVIADDPPPGGWVSLVRPAVFVPATKTIDAQLRDFKASRTHIAIVSDEYGGTAGLVTIEDLLEEIVGEIRDEDDVESEPVVDEGQGSFVFSAKVSFDELRDRLDLEIESEGFETVGGYILSRVGRVPAVGETFDVDGLAVEVLEAERRRIHKVRIRKPAPVPNP